MCNHAKFLIPPILKFLRIQVEDLEYTTMNMPLPKFILVHASAGTELSRNNSGTIQFRIEQRMTVQQPMRQESL